MDIPTPAEARLNNEMKHSVEIQDILEAIATKINNSYDGKKAIEIKFAKEMERAVFNIVSDKLEKRGWIISHSQRLNISAVNHTCVTYIIEEDRVSHTYFPASPSTPQQVPFYKLYDPRINEIYCGNQDNSATNSLDAKYKI